MIRQIILSLCLLAVGTITTTFAHTVWIEPKDDQMVIRFAEPGNDFETSPGHMDSLSAPNSFMLVTNAPVAIEAPKKSDHFLFVGACPTNTVCTETTFTVRGGRKPIFYARWQPSNAGAATPLLTLDIVPTGKDGEARIYFRGKPAGGIKATLRTPDGKEQEITSDAEGFVHFASKQAGLHLLTLAHHREPLAGFHGGRSYEQTSHNCALTWRQ